MVGSPVSRAVTGLALVLAVAAASAALVGFLASPADTAPRSADVPGTIEPLRTSAAPPARSSPAGQARDANDEPPDARPVGPAGSTQASDPPIAWRRSRAVGLPYGGRLESGVQLPAGGRDFFTWDPVVKSAPSRGWRRWGTDRLVRVLLSTLRRYREHNPGAARVGVGDLSRPRGGDFGRSFGGLGHASHQNGLDADLYYPRRDRRERRPHAVRLVDRGLAQELVDAFVQAGAAKVFVGPRLGLGGPRDVVQPLAHHDDHLHVRIR